MTPRDEDVQTWQLWRPFYSIHRWILHRGCPPTIRRLRGLTRVAHLTVLIGGLGMFAGVLGAVAVWFSIKALGPGDDLGLAVFGGILGVCVILPLSRWIGRPWWHALAGILFSAVWFGLIDPVFDAYRQLGITHVATWGLATTTWCLGMATWMIDVRQPRTAWMLGLALLAGTIAMGAKWLHDWSERSGWMQNVPFIRHDVLNFILNFQPILLMLLLLCAALGMRLWGDEWRRGEREDASEAESDDDSQGLP